MSSQGLPAELVAATHNPGPAVHLALLGVVVVIGLLVFAVYRWRRRREEQTVDELGTREFSSEHGKSTEQSRPPAEQGGNPAAEQERHARPR